jgi:hypothetical protein
LKKKAGKRIVEKRQEAEGMQKGKKRGKEGKRIEEEK